jgi:hypothetical protein
VRTLSLRSAFTICVVGSTFGSATASASDGRLDCANTSVAWVKLSISNSENQDWAERLRQHLSAELARHEIAVCDGIPGASNPPLAIVRVVKSGTYKVGIEVRVEDQVTDKSVSRQLDLSRMPVDSHAMTVALGVSELLRASWAELNLNAARSKSTIVPPSVQHALDEDTPPSSAALGIELAAEEFSGGLRQGGVDISFEYAVASPLQLGLRLGSRKSLSVSAPDGSVSAVSWLAGLAPRLRITAPGATAGLLVTAHLDAARVQFSAEPVAGATAATGSGTAWLASLGVRGSLKLSQTVEFGLEAMAGDALNSVRARDSFREVVAMSGGWVGAAAGVNVWF